MIKARAIIPKRARKGENELNEERLYLLNLFIDNYKKIKSPQEKNRLYKAIVDSVIWARRDEDEPEIIVIDLVGLFGYSSTV